MKKVLSLLFVIVGLAFMSVCASAQDTQIYSYTENPKITRQYSSSYGYGKVTEVTLADQASIVEFEYNSNGSGWVSMGSKTVLKSNGKSYTIRGWGYIDQDDTFNEMQLDQRYNVSKGRYLFTMIFDPVTAPTTYISIYEDGYKGFYWEGITLNRFDTASGSGSGSGGEISGSKSNGQQEIVARFIITSAKKNNVDVTQAVVNRGGTQTVFYNTADGDLYMANYSEKNDTQSWGPVYDFSTETKEETSNSYKADIFRFSWNYHNSYDSNSGTCQCELTKIYKPQGVVSILRMVTETLDVIEYTGYLDGSLNLSSF